MRLGLTHHPLDLLFIETRRRGDLDRLLLVGAKVLRMDVHDTVGVDIEGDLDLRQSAWRWRGPDQIKLTEQLVVSRHLALALEDANSNRRLTILSGREDLALLGRNRGVLFDELGEHAAQGFDTK